ncbi:MAG: Ig-like domain-containing protein [Bradymonadia bacterium]
MARRVDVRHWCWLLVFAQLAGCASANQAEEDPEELQCREGYTVGGDGECSIPSLAPAEDVETPDMPFEEPTIIEDQASWFMNQEGDGEYEVYVGESLDIRVRVTNGYGEPAPDRQVNFELLPVDSSDVFGSALAVRRATTNEFGVAEATVVAGDRPAYFKVEMTSPDTEGIPYFISVIQRPEGDPLQPPGEGGMIPGGGISGACLGTKGVYSVTNLYEPAAAVDQGVFEVLDDIYEAVSNPGRFAGRYIEDRIDGFWGSVIRAAIEPVINFVVDYVLNNYAPDWVRWTLLVVEDVTAILTNLEIQGTLELGDPEPMECRLRGAHTWDTLVFIWRAGCPAGNDMCGRYPVEMNRIGVDLSRSEFDARLTRTIGPVADMEIDAHPMNLNLAVAIIWFVENYVLPQRLNVNSFGELLGLIIPCDAVGDVARDYLSGVPFVGFAVGPFVERACERGLEAAGNYLTRQLTDSLNVSVFEISGTAKLRDTTGNQFADKISEGRWEDGLPGDFTGERRQ